MYLIMNNNLYNILELKNDANINDIKHNFKKLALKYHPDKNKSIDANEKFNQIRIAYEILSNLDKKDKYDKMTSIKQKHFLIKSNIYLIMMMYQIWIN